MILRFAFAIVLAMHAWSSVVLAACPGEYGSMCFCLDNKLMCGTSIDGVAARIAHPTWIDLPAGHVNGNVQSFDRNDACFMKEGTPTAKTKFGVTVYAPGKQTYGSECAPGTPVPPETP